MKQLFSPTALLFLVFFTASSTRAETLYFHNDHLGTPQVLTDENQNVVWKATFDSFGTANEDVAMVEQNLRLPGQYLDRETGLHYNYFRTYDPAIGRYPQSDPLGLDGGVSTYGYAYQNPVFYTDPYGLFGVDSIYSAIYKATGGWSPSQKTIDRAAGFGDGISTVFSLGYYSTADFREDQGIGGVNECSESYGNSKIAGYTTAAIAGTAMAARAAGWSIEGSFYMHGGGGVNVLQNGARRFAVDWHKFKLTKKGPMVNRPHYHRGKTKNQMKKHRPWQGGW